MNVLFNYMKFAIYQILGFLLSLPKLNKIKKNPNKFSLKEKFEFLQRQAKNSLSIVDIKLNILGSEFLPDEPVLFVSNHTSMLDSFILAASVDRPIGCVIADEPIWKNLPIISEWTRLIKCVYIDRKNNREGLKSINEASNNILGGHSMAIFPEGDLTWVKDPNSIVSNFRIGSLKIAYKAGCPIVPFVIKNSRETYQGYHPIGKIKSIPVEVEFLNPIYDHINDPKLKSSLLAENIRNKMIEKIEEFKESNIF